MSFRVFLAINLAWTLVTVTHGQQCQPSPTGKLADGETVSLASPDYPRLTTRKTNCDFTVTASNPTSTIVMKCKKSKVEIPTANGKCK